MPKKKIIIKDEGVEEGQETQKASLEEEFQLPPKKVWDDEEIKKYLKRRAKLLRHTPTQAEIDKDKDGPRLTRVKKVFGTYEYAILAAELELPPRPWGKYSNDELLDAVRGWSRQHPESKLSPFLLDNHPDLPSTHIIHKRFGGSYNYFHLAGVPCENGVSPWHEENSIESTYRPADAMIREIFHQGR